MTLKTLFQDALALIFGAILTLAFAPFSLFPLAILSGAGLLALWLNTSPGRAFWRGWLFGAGLFGTGVYWVFISIHTFGNTSVLLAGFVTCLFIAILALFPATAGYLLNRFFPYTNNTKMLCAFPAIWVIFEWIRSWIFTGFPWLFLGYSQIDSPLKGYAPLFGIYGVTLAVLISSGLLVSSVIKFKQTRYKHVAYNLLAFAGIWLAGGLLSYIPWTHPVGKPVKVSLIQGNIAQSLKWSDEQILPTLALYQKLTEEHWDSQIIVWPEAAVPIPLEFAANYLEKLRLAAEKHNTTIILGVPIRNTKRDAFYNAVIAIGKGDGVYTKHRLVPFGEFIPLKRFVGGLFDLLEVPMSDFVPGTKLPKPIMAGNIKIATFICYEIAYPEQVLSRDGTIDMILTVSNDAWFGHSIAQPQHLEMARMRALEMGRPILFVSNDGITAIINAKGKIQAAAPRYETYVLTGDVQTTQGKTLWQRFGTDPVFIILIILLFVAIRRHKK